MSTALAVAAGLACLAHRGQVNNPTADEETRQAIKIAFAEGCDVELDVHLTADNVPVIQHDPTLTRTLGEPGIIHDYTADEYLTFRTLPNQQKPITYETAMEILHHHPNRRMVIEVWYGWWTPSSLLQLQSIAAAWGVAGQVTLYAGNLDQVARIHAADPYIHVGIKGVDATADPSQIPDYTDLVFLDGDAVVGTVDLFAAGGRTVVAGGSLTRTDFQPIEWAGFNAICTNRTRAWVRYERTHP